MRKIAAYITIFLVFTINNTLIASDKDWHMAKSTHFIVYYKNASEDFLEMLIERSEEYYDKIAENLGFRRYNFWLWDNRAEIYIYDTAQDYRVATGQPPWSAGCAIIRDKVIHTFPNAKGFFVTILPHEMGHIIFREFVGFDNPAVPTWLDEGVASYQENLKYSRAKILVRTAIEEGNFINLEKLSAFNPHIMADNESVNLFYAEAISMVDFLIKNFGKDNFVIFCQNLRDKKDLQKAISSSYPFADLHELDRSWQRYLQDE